MRWKEVEERRKKQNEVKRKEEEKRKTEEAKREEKRKLQEEETRREQERLRVEEEKRRAEVERERHAREVAAKEELAHRIAVAAEEERCRKRDSQRWGYKPWTPDAALERFHIIMAEFSAAKYTPMEPVTTQSIPWPTLLKPDTFTFEAITWENVEAFLRHMKSQVQLMFHPDRWCSRNILSAIVDTKVQEALKDAGGVVSQAVNQWIDKNGGGKRGGCAPISFKFAIICL
ncbi:hypothetical protein BDZ94DRAFT_1261160 [Collybia nuda]|uniref:Uncharacterized protein n=1 Tax=Collybia nuda TaxID=64659 RepID=A0A9P6CE71_9AGAR|nr:hypothetical protein BDZ94DRAFT_1261160 [Collybia nuda]